MSQPERPEIQIFNAALELSVPAERAAYLDRACAGDAPLRRKVEALLQACGEADEFFQTVVAPPRPAGELSAPARPAGPTGTALVPLTEKPGDRIGRYKLLQQIGEGGCGVVFMADQEEPVRRRVALKVIKLGMDTRQVVARFEAERQALALMDHPNIAKVLDAGATQTGRPYFVMELVRGVRLTEFCEENHLTMRQRLDLFVLVCHAVQHAHQKGIIHRDLKPSNILVTVNDGVPVPKVIDFGIAKATTGQQLTDKTLFTAFEQFMGTPAYMSPEQAVLTSLDIDTRSDIYSLGVLLYELLTGKTPFDARELWEAGVDEMRRTIREVEPVKPSTRLTLERLAASSASSGKSEIRNLKSEIDKDLDWIVMKALEKDRTRRYETANGFAADIQRHLNYEAVTARPPSLLYKFQKTVRRNKGAFAATAAVLLALLAGLGLTAWQAVRANCALEELRATAPAFAEQARTLAAKDRFDEAMEKLAYATKLRPNAPEYLVQLGDLLQCRFRFTDAAAAYRRALQLRPGDARAQAGATLCNELLAAPRTSEGKLTRESLSKLHLAMQREQRPAAELLPVARLLGEEKKLLINYWAARLKDLSISSENPIEKRLVVQDDGLLSFDLCGTKVVDLTPLEGMPLGSLNLCDCEELTDLQPLRELRSLTKLDITSTKVMDLSPLRELKLQELDASGTKIFDISPLRGMPLKDLSLAGSTVTDLSPLAGMPLTKINLSYTPIENFAPLSGLPLEYCNLRRCRLSDLSVLRGMPLKELILWGCAQARHYSTLAELPALESLFLPDEIRTLPPDERAAIARLRTNTKLQRIGTDVAGGNGHAALGSAESFWREWDRDAKFLEALNRGEHISSMHKLPDGTYQLVCNDKTLTDLSILADAPITVLAINKNKNISDLNPIRNLRLTLLNMAGLPVKDIAPLRGMPLEHLYMAATKVSDLSPLKGMSLRTLYIDGCPITNVSVLAEIPSLETLCLPINAKGIESLRTLPKLERIGFDAIGLAPGRIPIPCCSAEVFWKTWDGMKWARALEEADIKFSAHQRTDGLLNVSIHSSQFTNCSLFKRASICELDLSRTSVSELLPLLDCPNLARLILPAGVQDTNVLRRFASGVHLSFRNADGSEHNVDEFWKTWNSLSWSRALTQAGVKHRAVQEPDGSWRVNIETKTFSDCAIFKGANISKLTLSNTAVTNLSPLDGMPLQELWLYGTGVADLTPLRGLPLRSLGLMDTKVTDLSPLAGMKLKNLLILGTMITNLHPIRGMPLEQLQLNKHTDDLSALRGMPLHELQMGASLKATDFSPLTNCTTLERLLLPPNATGIDFLRRLPKLERLSFKWDMTVHRPAQSTEEFWAEYNQQRKSN